MMQRLPALTVGTSMDKIGKSLRADEVKLSVSHRPAGELARIGGSKTWQRPKRIEQRPLNRQSTMDMKLADIFASKARGSGKEQNDPLIEQLSAAWMPERPQSRF